MTLKPHQTDVIIDYVIFEARERDDKCDNVFGIKYVKWFRKFHANEWLEVYNGYACIVIPTQECF